MCPCKTKLKATKLRNVNPGTELDSDMSYPLWICRAAYRIDTKPEKITDASTGVEFVVRVATALKDKPKVVA